MLIPEGKIALGKLAQAMIHGAVVIQIRGNFDAGMRLVKEVADQAPVTIVNSINPYRLQGQKTAAFEIVEELGRAPDYHCLPVGNAGNITAHWIGYSEYASLETAACAFCDGSCKYGGSGVTGTRPVMVGLPGGGCRAVPAREDGRQPGDRRDRDPHRSPAVLGPGLEGAAGIRRLVR